MSDFHQFYIILWISSTGVLIIFAIIVLQQFCVTDQFDNKPRLRRTLLTFWNIFNFIILNCFVYINALWYHKVIFSTTLNVHTIFILWEGYTAIVAFHTYRLLFIFILDTIYTTTRISAPKWLTWLINFCEFIMITGTVITHTAAVLFNNINWIYGFFLLLGVIILIFGALVICQLVAPLRLLNSVDFNSDIHSAKMKVKGAISVGFILIILSLIDIGFTVEKIEDFGWWSFNFDLVTNINTSAFVIFLSLALTMWIFQPKLCCVIPEDSVFDVWCFQCCCSDDMDEYTIHDVLLQESTGNTIKSSVQQIKNVSVNDNNNPLETLPEDYLPDLTKYNDGSNDVSKLKDYRVSVSVKTI
eukprot:206220_1